MSPQEAYETALAKYRAAKEQLHYARYDYAEAECLRDLRAGVRVLRHVDIATLTDEELIDHDDFRDLREKYLPDDDDDDEDEDDDSD